MKKLITLSILSILYVGAIQAQRGNSNNHDRDYDDVYGQNQGYGQPQGQQGYGQNNPNQGYGHNPNNPYNDPNYYPSNNGRSCGTPPPPPCYNPPRPIVIVPPTYCAPVYIAPRPVYGYRPYNQGHRRHGRNYSYGYGRRW